MLPERADTLIAHKVISLAAELRSTEKRVGSLIIDHFNRKDGRCDPSIDRLADLLDLSRRTVMRATERLDELGLIGSTRHGGRSNRNAYQPNWVRFRELDRAWNALMAQGREARRPVTNCAPEHDTRCHLPGDRPVTQTSISNQSKEPVPDGRREQDNDCCDNTNLSKGPAGREKRESLNSPRELQSTTPSSREAAWTAAERRWFAELHNRFAGSTDVYVAIIDAIDESLRTVVTQAELERCGSGVDTLIARLRERDLLETLGLGPAVLACGVRSDGEACR